MKKVFTLLLLAAAFNASAQFCRKDTTTQYSINNTSFVKTPASRIINYYKSPTDNQLDSQLVQQWGEGSNGQNQWLNLNKTAYAYANGLKTLELYSIVPQGQTAWIKSKKQKWTYNAASRVLVSADSIYIPANNNYVLNRTELNVYDANNNLTQRTLFDAFSGISRTNNTYNSANYVTLIKDSKSTDNGINFVLQAEAVITLDAKNREIEKVTSSINIETNMIELRNKFLNSYDANDNKTSTENQKYQNSNWVGQSRTEYTFNADKQITVEANPSWNGTQWVNSTQTLTTYLNKLPLLTENQSWNIQAPGNTWTTTSQTDRNFNQYGKVLIATNSVWAGPMTGMVPLGKSNYTYIDSSEWTELISTTWNAQTSTYVNSYKNERSFNAKGRITREASFNWIAQQNAWRPNSINDYTFSTSNKLIRQEDRIWDNGLNQIRPFNLYIWEFHPTYDYETANTRQYNFNPANGTYGTHIRTEYACVNSTSSTNNLKNIAKNSL